MPQMILANPAFKKFRADMDDTIAQLLNTMSAQTIDMKRKQQHFQAPAR